MNQTRVVILGGGFGGLSVARRLSRSTYARKHCAVTIVDQHHESTYTPWLHEVAAGSSGHVCRHDADIELEAVRGVRYRHGVVVHIDSVHRHVVLEDESTIPFDILVLALGTVSNDFDIPGVTAFAYDLKRTAHALSIRERFSEIVLATKHDQMPKRIVVAGAGVNGIECAAECATTIRHLERKNFIARGRISVMLLGSTRSILPMLGARFQRKAEKRLERIGIALQTNTALTAVHRNAITVRTLDDGIPTGDETSIAADMVVAALGVKVPDIVMELPWKKTERGRILVDNTLRIPGEPGVFVLGDCMAFDEQRQDPQTAQAAVAQSRIVARNILALVRQKPLFTYRVRKTWDIVVTLGEGYALGRVFGIAISGYTVAILRRIIDAKYFFFALPLWEACARMTRGFLSYGKNHLKNEIRHLASKRHSS